MDGFLYRFLALVLSLALVGRGLTYIRKAPWWVCVLYVLSGLWLLYGLGCGPDADLSGFALPGILFSFVDQLIRLRHTSK